MQSVKNRWNIDGGYREVLVIAIPSQNQSQGVPYFFFQEPANEPFDIFETLDGEHGRIETRRYFMTCDIGWLPGKEQWTGINTITKRFKAAWDHDYLLKILGL